MVGLFQNIYQNYLNISAFQTTNTTTDLLAMLNEISHYNNVAIQHYLHLSIIIINLSEHKNIFKNHHTCWDLKIEHLIFNKLWFIFHTINVLEVSMCSKQNKSP